MPTRSLEFIVQDEKLLNALESIEKNTKDMHLVLDRLVDEAFEIESEFFAKPKGLKRNAPSTIKRKGKNSPLVNTGRLARTLSHRGAPEQKVKVTSDYAIIGVLPVQYWVGINEMGGGGAPKRSPFTPLVRKPGKVRMSERSLHEIFRISGYGAN